MICLAHSAINELVTWLTSILVTWLTGIFVTWLTGMLFRNNHSPTFCQSWTRPINELTEGLECVDQIRPGPAVTVCTSKEIIFIIGGQKRGSLNSLGTHTRASQVSRDKVTGRSPRQSDTIECYSELRYLMMVDNLVRRVNWRKALFVCYDNTLTTN